MENSKKCALCGKTSGSFIIPSKLCAHRICTSCLSSSLKEGLSSKGLPFPCPVSTCKTIFSLLFLQNVLPNENLEELLKDLIPCSICLEVRRPKKQMKKLKCKHMSCEDCEKIDKCLLCLKGDFLKRNDELISSKKPTFSTKKMRKCEKCDKESINTENIACCKKRICLGCMKKRFKKKIAKEEKENDEKKEEKSSFDLNCPFCHKGLDEEVISEVLNEEEYKKYRKLGNRRKCEVCLLNKERENIRKFDNNEHRVCKDCLWEYLKTVKGMAEDNKIPEKFYCLVEKCQRFVMTDDIKEILEEFDEHFLVGKKSQRMQNKEDLQKSKDEIKNEENIDEELEIKEFKLKEKKQSKSQQQQKEGEIKGDSEQKKMEKTDGIQEKKNDHSKERKLQNYDEENKLYEIIETTFTSKDKEISKTPEVYLMQCKICMFDVKIEQTVTLECEHRFCKSCISSHCESRIKAGLISHSLMICPEENCGKHINYFIIKANVSAENFAKYDTFLTKHTLENNVTPGNNEEKGRNTATNISKNSEAEKIISCPKCQNYYAIASSSQYFNCSHCQERYCANEKCLGKWSDHLNKTCEDFIRKPKGEEDNEFERYIKEQKLQRCPVCNIVVEKIKNCNYVQCASLKCQKKTTFCYLCSQLLKQCDLSTHYLNNSAFSLCKKMKEKNDRENIVKEGNCESTSINPDEGNQKNVDDNVNKNRNIEGKQKSKNDTIEVEENCERNQKTKEIAHIGDDELILNKKNVSYELIQKNEEKVVSEQKEKSDVSHLEETEETIQNKESSLESQIKKNQEEFKGQENKEFLKCRGCYQSLERNHGIISIEVRKNKLVDSYIYCANKEQAYCNYCLKSQDDIENLQRHLQYHIYNEHGEFTLNDYFNFDLQKIPMFITSYNEQYPLELKKIQNEKDKEYYFNFTSQDKDFSENQPVIFLNSVPIAICEKRLIAQLKCKICEIDIKLINISAHFKNHKISKKKY